MKGWGFGLEELEGVEKGCEHFGLWLWAKVRYKVKIGAEKQD